MSKGVTTTGAEGELLFKTVDLDFVTFLISQKNGVYRREMSNDDAGGTEALVKVPSMQVELHAMEPYEDDAARSAQNIKYVFVLKNMMPVEKEEFEEQMRRFELDFLSQNLLVEPVSMRAAFRQLRRWMTETDKVRLMRQRPNKDKRHHNRHKRGQHDR